MRCDSCGMEIPDHAVFCPKCGVNIGNEGPGTANSALPAPPPPRYSPGSSRKTSGFAIASLIMGIGGFICFPLVMSILAIIFGVISKREIKKSEGMIGGKGMATAGLTLGIVGLAIPVVLAAIVIPLGIANIGETRTITRTVPLNGATSVETILNMHSGELEVTGGSLPTNMVEGTFTYNVSRWKPDIDHSFSGLSAEVEIEQPSHWWSAGSWRARNEWLVELNETVPVKLKADLKSVKSSFNLKDTTLESFDVSTTSGNLNADLSGEQKLLKSVSTRVTSGNTNLNITGTYPESIEADVEATSGNITINLDGFWTGNLDLDVASTSGNITITLPDDVGVYITASASSGEINAPELKAREKDEEKAFVNEAYEKTDTTLIINIKATSGNINLKVGG